MRKQAFDSKTRNWRKRFGYIYFFVSRYLWCLAFSFLGFSILILTWIIPNVQHLAVKITNTEKLKKLFEILAPEHISYNNDNGELMIKGRLLKTETEAIIGCLDDNQEKDAVRVIYENSFQAEFQPDEDAWPTYFTRYLAFLIAISLLIFSIVTMLLPTNNLFYALSATLSFIIAYHIDSFPWGIINIFKGIKQ